MALDVSSLRERPDLTDAVFGRTLPASILARVALEGSGAEAGRSNRKTSALTMAVVASHNDDGCILCPNESKAGTRHHSIPSRAVASTLSTRRPSRSTTSKRQPEKL